jgi:hypothetical protein
MPAPKETELPNMETRYSAANIKLAYKNDNVCLEHCRVQPHECSLARTEFSLDRRVASSI